MSVHAQVERDHWWFSARRRILRALVEELVPPGNRAVVLDIGCGVGATLTAFHPEYACIGYDPSPDAIEFGTETHPGIDLRLGMAADAGPDIARADVVLLNDVIEHVPDDRALLTEVTTHMKPGAWLIITVPADMKLWSPHDVALQHYRRYDPAMLRKAVAGLPLNEKAVTHFNARLYPIVRAVRMVAKAIGHSAGQGGTDLRPTPKPANSVLRSMFAGEIPRLLQALRGTRPGYSRGVSLLGVYQRTGGPA